jgi:hypothetical protein
MEVSEYSRAPGCALTLGFFPAPRTVPAATAYAIAAPDLYLRKIRELSIDLGPGFYRDVRAGTCHNLAFAMWSSPPLPFTNTNID